MRKEKRRNDFEARFDGLIGRIERAKDALGHDADGQATREETKHILSFMLSPDDGGYCMPNLQGCLPFPIDGFYEFMDAANPANMEEFAAVVGLALARFKSRKKAICSIKENGLGMTIHSPESFARILAFYELGEAEAKIIIDDVLGQRGHLSEWEELTLESHEAPSGVLGQFPNIVSLPSEAFSFSVASAIFEAARLKLTYGYPIGEADPSNQKAGFVGPFFYADGKVLFKRLPVAQFDVRRRFFDADKPHMALFETLGLSGDYGNYPRGRVLYDNFRGRFVVYADTVLLRKEIKEEIKRHFGLDGQRVVFRKDEHYTHDGL